MTKCDLDNFLEVTAQMIIKVATKKAKAAAQAKEQTKSATTEV